MNRCQRHPLARGLRLGGLVLGALQDVALAYLRREAGQTPLLWQMAMVPVADLRQRAADLGVGEVVDCTSVMGGGTLPGVTIPSAGIAVERDLTAELRESSSTVVARVTAGNTVCDLRTVFPAQDPIVVKALAR